ncbi:MAG: hypothetical protein LAP21_25945 [Acidobacteriia bacterium]|nr:hypothetical protein [Terriglobia bacterium]
MNDEVEPCQGTIKCNFGMWKGQRDYAASIMVQESGIGNCQNRGDTSKTFTAEFARERRGTQEKQKLVEAQWGPEIIAGREIPQFVLFVLIRG